MFDGQDFSTFRIGPDGVVSLPYMDLSFTPIGGVEAARQTILRKLRCPPGSMDDDTWGVDLTSYQGAALSSADLSTLQRVVAAAIEAEEYVESASVQCLLALGTSELIFDCRITLDSGDEFTLAFALSTAGIRAIVG